MTREEFDRLKALTGSDDVLLDGKPMEDDPAPTNLIFERAFVGKDDDGAYVPLALTNLGVAQLGTKILPDPDGEYIFATLLHSGVVLTGELDDAGQPIQIDQAQARTVRVTDASTVQAVRKFLELVQSGQARVGVEL